MVALRRPSAAVTNEDLGPIPLYGGGGRFWQCVGGKDRSWRETLAALAPKSIHSETSALLLEVGLSHHDPIAEGADGQLDEAEFAQGVDVVQHLPRHNRDMGEHPDGGPVSLFDVEVAG
jgi:hypothetical protein